MTPIGMIILFLIALTLTFIVCAKEQGNYDSQDKSITFKGIARVLFKH